jgi:hypothetical protein
MREVGRGIGWVIIVSIVKIAVVRNVTAEIYQITKEQNHE